MATTARGLLMPSPRLRLLLSEVMATTARGPLMPSPAMATMAVATAMVDTVRLWRLRLRPLRLLRISQEQLLQCQLPESFVLFQVEVEFKKNSSLHNSFKPNTKYQIKISSKK